MVCADNLAIQVDRYWELGASGTAGPVVAASLALMFSGQIFADFAGYSSIAIGLGYLLGYRFPDNFNAPYIAGTFSNFWGRWHMTLSRWLRDYLYIPLGGNRGSRARTYVNLMIVMLLGGLWHGAAYHFIVWGALHGGALAIERALGMNQLVRHSRLWRVLWLIVVQVVVLVAWVFFRSPTVGDAVRFLASLTAEAGEAPSGIALGLLFLTPIAALHLWAWMCERRLVAPLGAAGRTVLAALMIAAIFTLSAPSSAFIYFQF
jgi:alginate O-acetyltransferase complex protein AlgI